MSPLSRWVGLGWDLVYLLVACTVSIGGLSSPVLERATLENQVNGTAWRPFVYRQVPAVCARVILAPWTADELTAFGEAPATQKWVRRFKWVTGWSYPDWTPANLAVSLVGAGINFVCVLLFLYAFRSFLDGLFRAPPTWLSIIPAATIYLTVYMNVEGVYSYDYPQILLFTLGLMCIHRGWWKLFYPLLVLDTFNKETALLLILVFGAFYWRRVAIKSLAVHLVTQLAAYATIILSLRREYSENPGEPSEFHLFDHNVRCFLNPEDSYGALSIMLIAGSLFFVHWGSKPAFLRRASIIFWPLFGLTLIMGYINELRDYYELWVIAAPIMGMTVATILGVRIVARDAAAVPWFGSWNGVPAVVVTWPPPLHVKKPHRQEPRDAERAHAPAADPQT